VDKTWEIDDATTVKAHFGFVGKKAITVNGKEVHSSRKAIPKEGVPFALPDGRPASLTFKAQFAAAPEVDLRVGGELMVEIDKKTPIACAKCGAPAKPYDRFCGKCGDAMPTAEDYRRRKYVKSATGAIKWLAAIFFFSGILLFFATQAQMAPALAKLQGMDAAAPWPTPIEGRSYTVGELRKQFEWEPWGVLIVNGILAAIMVSLALWSRRSPLPAVLIATATYAVVIVANAVSNPATLAQGWFLKVIIIAFLFRGIKAALALRSSNA
jgi:hypothetical protein